MAAPDAAPPAFPPEAPRNCPLCPRLVEFRTEAEARLPGAWNGAVPSWGDPEARLLVVGLAPGLRGANATGRPFTGDYAGDLLYSTLGRHGFAEGRFEARPDDGLRLIDCVVTNAVRCVPPQNKPTGPEVSTCRGYLSARIAATERLRVIVALGKIAHDSVVRALGGRVAAAPFGHGATAGFGDIALLGSYHCSRYNTNTGRLTEPMFDAVFAEARRRIDATP